jgi:hypothetical protein
MVFAKKKHKNDITSVDIKSIATGFLGVVGNKGACAVAFRIMNTSICFITSHLAAHQSHYEERNQMFQEIVHGLQIGDVETYLTHHYDAVIWFGKIEILLSFGNTFHLGDLNYRINYSAEQILLCVKKAKWDSLHKRDQLFNEMNKKNVFCGFKEFPIDFPPTYKLNMPKKEKEMAATGEEEDEDEDDEEELYQSSSDEEEVIFFSYSPNEMF